MSVVSAGTSRTRNDPIVQFWVSSMYGYDCLNNRQAYDFYDLKNLMKSFKNVKSVLKKITI